ncbi:MAG: hypothetical protein ACI4XB_04685 [Ruminococcus sp.]
MMKQIWKKGIAAVCAAGTALAMVPFSAAALSMEPEAVKVLAIGDDCLAPVVGMTSAVEYVADYLGGTWVNRAEIGMTAADLVEDLKTDASLQADVQAADVILVSVGVNDIITPVLYGNTDIIDGSKYSTLEGLANGMPNDMNLILELNSRLMDTLPQIVEQTNATVTEAVQLLRSKNSSANIIVQKVSNPLAVDFKAMSDTVSQNRRAALSTLFTYMEACLQGSTDDSTPIVPVGVNEAISSLSNVAVADFYEPYVGAPGEKALGFYLSNIANLDMTFSSIGQVVIAAASINADEALSNGNGSVIAAAYGATGERSNLETLRPSLDEIINTASENTETPFFLGDVDSNDTVDADDAYLTLTEYATVSVGMPSGFIPAQRRAADMDNSNAADANDAYLMLKYYAACSVGQDADLETFLQENGRK